MPPVKPLETLSDLLTGQVFGKAELDEFVDKATVEGQWHDFKSGRQPEKDLKNTIRQYVTGFANSEGGILIVGVTEPSRTNPKRVVDGVTAHKTAALTDWAIDVLQPAAPYFSPAPRIESVPHNGKEVLVIATARSPQLIPYIKNGKMHHAMRFGKSTIDAPEWLLSDLVLGRRQHPILQARSIDLDHEAKIWNFKGGFAVINAPVELEVANLSLATAREVRIGVVVWTLTDAPRIQPNATLLQYVEAIEPTDTFEGSGKGVTWQLREASIGEPFKLPPFGMVKAKEVLADLLRVPPSGILEFAVYLLPEGSPPTWFQVTWRYALHTGGKIRGGAFRGTAEISRTEGRPRISWGHGPS